MGRKCIHRIDRRYSEWVYKGRQDRVGWAVADESNQTEKNEQSASASASTCAYTSRWFFYLGIEGLVEEDHPGGTRGAASCGKVRTGLTQVEVQVPAGQELRVQVARCTGQVYRYRGPSHKELLARIRPSAAETRFCV